MDKTLVERLEALAVRVEKLLTDWGDMEEAEERDAIARDIRALRATGDAATVDLGEHGLLRHATVNGVTVTAKRPDQVQGCCFMGGGIPRATGEGVMVPREPTTAMIEAAERMADELPLSDWGKMVNPTPEQTYAAMLAAAPPPPLRDAGAVGWTHPALGVVNDAANDARHRGDYNLANALVRARIDLHTALAAHPAPQQPDEVARFWREAFTNERAMRYMGEGMKAEQARIHAETDATAVIAALNAAQEAGHE